jgi:hAT family C-terminal dimerisation region
MTCSRYRNRGETPSTTRLTTPCHSTSIWHTTIYTEDFPDQKDKLIDNPLAWWNREAWKYPILSKMAYDLFSIPGMSECERVFSQAKKLVTDERNRFGPATIEADECLKNWINSGLLEV